MITKQSVYFRMLSRTLLFCIVALFAASHVQSANILGYFTITSPSHIIIHMATVKALTDAGHNVTVVTRLPLKEKNTKFHHIHIPMQQEDEDRMRAMFKIVSTTNSRLESLRNNFALMSLMNEIELKSLLEPAVQELMNNKGNHFDLMILGYAFNDHLLGIADHFKCPLIISWVNVPVGIINQLVGNPEGISYIPFMLLGNGPMGFLKRVLNMVLSQFMTLVMKPGEYQVEKFYKKNFPAERGYRSVDEMRKNVSLVFCSTFFSEGTIRPYTPSFIEIGGIQAKENPNPLPKDIEDFLESADEGVIFFSLGSNVKSADFGPTATQILFNVLADRKEKIIWKWDTPNGPGNASNILYKKWLPQDDILAHPKVKLFITHGGKGSITEAQYHGVPMVSMPIFGDQFANSNDMQAQGYGLVLNHHTMTEDEFKAQLELVLYNSTYYDTIKQYSTLYRDRPMTARKSVVYWSEYVIRHHGAAHMQSPRVHLNFWQYNSLDVIAFIVGVLFVIFFIVRYVIRCITELLCRRCQSNLKKKEI